MTEAVAVLDPAAEAQVYTAETVHALAQPGVPRLEDVRAAQDAAMNVQTHEDESGVHYSINGEELSADDVGRLFDRAQTHWELSDGQINTMLNDASFVSGRVHADEVPAEHSDSLARLRERAEMLGYNADELTPDELSGIGARWVSLSEQVREDERRNGGRMNPVRFESLARTLPTARRAREHAPAVEASEVTAEEPLPAWAQAVTVQIHALPSTEDAELAAGDEPVDPEDEDLLAGLGFRYADEEGAAPLSSDPRQPKDRTPRGPSVSLRERLTTRASKVWAGVTKLHDAVDTMLKGIAQLPEVQQARADIEAGAVDLAAAYERARARIAVEVPHQWARAEAWLNANVPVVVADIQHSLDELRDQTRRALSERIVAGALGAQAVALGLAELAGAVHPDIDDSTDHR